MQVLSKSASIHTQSEIFHCLPTWESSMDSDDEASFLSHKLVSSSPPREVSCHEAEKKVHDAEKFMRRERKSSHISRAEEESMGVELMKTLEYRNRYHLPLRT